MKYRAGLLGVFLVITTSSCIGVSADITIGTGGAGVIALEYRLSRQAEALGKLDGNESRPLAPIGRLDFERTAARIDGLKMRSFASKTVGQDVVNTVKLEFKNPQTLVRFLDATGQRARLTEENGVYRLRLLLFSGTAGIDPEVLALFKTLSEDYALKLSLTAPQEGTLTVYDAAGKAVGNTAGVTVGSKGKTVSFQAPVGTVFSYADGVQLELTFF